MLVVPHIQKLLDDANLREIARRTGVPYSTLNRFMRTNAISPSPAFNTVKALSDYLEARARDTLHD